MKVNKLLLLVWLIFNNCSAQKVYLNSIPKCGTYLALNCIELLTKKKFNILEADKAINNTLPQHDALLWHIHFSEASAQNLEKNNFKGIFIYRDPRDKIVSAAYWILKHPHLIKAYGYSLNKKPTVQELITKLIPTTKVEYNQYKGWLKVPFFYSFKFEDLVGQKGGGDDAKQREVIFKICKHLEINPEVELIDNCLKNFYGKSYSFREGKIGGWKKHFTKNHLNIAKKELGALLIELGYEKDLNW